MSGPSLSIPLKHWPIVLLPALLGLLLIAYFSVDVPKEDAWITPGTIIEKVIGGTVTFQDLFSQHSTTESREAFPRLIFLAVGFTVGWHATIFMVLSWLCVVGTFLFLVQRLYAVTTYRPRLFLFLALLMGAMLFSPAQWENQLWGIQLILFIPPLCLATCLWLQSTHVSVGTMVLGCAALSLLSTFSYPNGMACWLLGAPFFTIWFTQWPVASRKERIKIISWTAFYLGFALGTIGLYFFDFEPEKISYSHSLIHLDLGLPFFAALVGAPFSLFFSAQAVVATWVGLGVLLGVFISIVMVIQEWIRSRDIDFAMSCYPWLCFLAYGLLSCLAITSGRAQLGPDVALVSEYASVSLWVSISLVGMASVLLTFSSINTSPATHLTFPFTLGIVSLLTFFAWVNGVGHMQREYLFAQQRLLNLRLFSVAPSNPFFASNSKWLSPPMIRKRFMLFAQEGILPIKPIGNWITERIQNPDPGEAGWFTTSREENIHLTPEEFIRGILPSTKALKIEGWAMLPHRGDSADFVILAQRQTTGALEVVTGFPTNIERPDIAMARNNPGLLHSGFSSNLDSMFVDNPQFLLFAVDVNNQRVYELQQEQPLRHVRQVQQFPSSD